MKPVMTCAPKKRPFNVRHVGRQVLLASLLCSANWIASAAAASDPMEEARVAQESANLMMAGKTDEAAEVWKKRIATAGLTPERQSNWCNALEAGTKLGLLRECLTTLGTLIEQPLPPDPYGLGEMRRTMAIGTLSLGYSLLGDFPKAIFYGKRSVELSLPTAKPMALGNLGVLYVKAGDLESGRKILGELEALSPDALVKETADATRKRLAGIPNAPASMIEQQVTNAGNLARKSVESALPAAKLNIANELKDYATALRLHEAMFPRLRSEFNEQTKNDLSSQAWIHLARAGLLMKLGRLAEARPLLEFAEKNNPLIAGQWFQEFYVGQIDESDGKFDDALRRYRRAVETIENLRATTTTEADKIGVIGDKQEPYARLVALLIKRGMAAEAFESAERGKARALVDLLAGKTDLTERATASASAGNSQALYAEFSKAQSALAASPTGGDAGQLRSVLTQARNQLQAAAPELASLVAVSYTPADKLRASLRADETLVEYYGDENTLFGFVVSRDKVRALSLDAKALAQVRPFRQAVQTPNGKDVDVLAKILNDTLVAPLGLPAKGTLTIVPHGSLHYLPFAALSDGKTRLIERYSLRVLPSASVLSLLTKRPPAANRNALILGNPDLHDKALDLPGAQHEAQEIAALNPANKLLLREAASKDALQTLGNQYGYIHLASHGTFDARTPRLSGLLLATAAGSKEPTDGMLTVDELYGLKLDADLVTLSACETALGDVQNGDDVIGLTRGFFYAGARSIVSSLWSVDDKATEQLMVSFYRALPTTGKAEALRKAQLEVMKKYPHPFYWAAFQLAGNDGQALLTTSVPAAEVKVVKPSKAK